MVEELLVAVDKHRVKGNGYWSDSCSCPLQGRI